MNKLSECEVLVLQKIAVEFLRAADFLLPDTAAFSMGITVGTLRRWCKLGKGPRPRVMFGQAFYDSSEIIEYNLNEKRRMKLRDEICMS